MGHFSPWLITSKRNNLLQYVIFCLDGRGIHKQSVTRNVRPWYKQKVKCHQETQTFEFCLFKSVDKLGNSVISFWTLVEKILCMVRPFMWAYYFWYIIFHITLWLKSHMWGRTIWPCTPNIQKFSDIFTDFPTWSGLNLFALWISGASLCKLENFPTLVSSPWLYKIYLYSIIFVFFIYLCFQIYFLTNHHCKTSIRNSWIPRKYQNF